MLVCVRPSNITRLQTVPRWVGHRKLDFYIEDSGNTMTGEPFCPGKNYFLCVLHLEIITSEHFIPTSMAAKSLIRVAEQSKARSWTLT